MYLNRQDGSYPVGGDVGLMVTVSVCLQHVLRSVKKLGY